MGKDSFVMKNSTTGFSSSSGFFFCLFNEFNRDCTLIFFETIFLFGVVVGKIKMFGKLGGFNDEESESGLLYVSIGGELSFVESVLYWRRRHNFFGPIHGGLV